MTSTTNDARDVWDQFGPPRREPPPPVVPREAESVEAWAELLSGDFFIEHEVSGEHWTGKRLRMDMLLHPKFEWPGGGRRPIGFEVKRPRTGEIGVFTKMAGQAVDYAQTRWNSDWAGALGDPPLVYVAVFEGRATNRQDGEQALSDRLLGRLGVMVFRPDKWHGLELRLSGERIWTLNRGPYGGGFKAARKVGSR